MIVSKRLAKRLFIAVNNPWICDINDDPVKLCYEMDYIIGEEKLTERLGLRTDFVVDDRYGLFPQYRLQIRLETLGTTTAIDLGQIIEVNVNNMMLELKVQSSDCVFKMMIPTFCEDLSAKAYAIKKNDFEIRNVNTNETNYKI